MKRCKNKRKLAVLGLAAAMALSLAAYGAENETEAELLRLLGAENKENLAGQCRYAYHRGRPG